MAAKRTIRSIPQERTPVREQPPKERATNFVEVNLGYDEAEAAREAQRCLFCAEPPCVAGCPVSIDIPGFIRRISDRDYQGAYDTIARTNLFGEFCDLEAGGLLDEALEPLVLVETIENRYRELWAELTEVEEFDDSQMHRIETRVRRLNALGFDVAELDITTDFAGATGAPVKAVNRGIVRIVDQFYYGGNVVYVDHGAGLVTAYLHLSEQAVAVGDTVEKGQLLGKVGATGRVTGPHLHLIARYGSVTVDPLSLPGLKGGR